MAVVYLGLGSNLNPTENLRLALRELRKRFTVVAVSPVYRNEPVGFEGGDFLNAVVCIETGSSPADVCQELDTIHGVAGRIRGDGRFVSRTLDIDLLLYGDQVIDEPPVSVPRSDILTYSFVLRPLVDLAPDLRHPVSGKTISELWRAFDSAAHPLHEERDVL